ncbi:DUF934 domain-containing protein [Nannocystaceae bacterium ST9]
MAELLHHPARHPSSRRDIIREGRIVEDDATFVSDEAALPEAGRVLVSLERAAREREVLAARPAGFGVRVPGDTEPEAIVEALGGSLDRVALIAIVVPKSTDGRHFSLARLLRERFGFRGELRALGDVLPDQLFFMHRCGYTAFDLRADKSLATGLRALEAFTVTYQAAADDPRPLWRRR